MNKLVKNKVTKVINEEKTIDDDIRKDRIIVQFSVWREYTDKIIQRKKYQTTGKI